jgi:hypothetical protein
LLAVVAAARIVVAVEVLGVTELAQGFPVEEARRNRLLQ